MSIWAANLTIVCFVMAGCGGSLTEDGTGPLISQAQRPSTAEPPAGNGPSVEIGEATFLVELARTPVERARGLSSRESIPLQTGMLFLYDSGPAGSFGMKKMQFPLDFIWISEECTVVDITSNVPVPAPGTADSDLTSYSSSATAAYNLEINSGEAERQAIRVGDAVRFSGVPGERAAACHLQ